MHGPWRDEHPDAALLETDPAPLDLGTYAEVARAVEGRFLCFLNSESRPLDPRWLEKLHARLTAPGVGLVGASGSYESFSSNAPFVTRPLRRRQFPPFPNPHVRTNAFMMSREHMLDLRWGAVTRKLDAWKLESGSQNITRQVWARGLDALVVGRDGNAYGRDRFYESNTFRRGDQPNLLVSDKRTREFEAASPDRRRWLFELAWGSAAVDTGDPDQPWIAPRSAAGRPDGPAEGGRYRRPRGPRHELPVSNDRRPDSQPPADLGRVGSLDPAAGRSRRERARIRQLDRCDRSGCGSRVLRRVRRALRAPARAAADARALGSGRCSAAWRRRARRTSPI